MCTRRFNTSGELRVITLDMDVREADENKRLELNQQQETGIPSVDTKLSLALLLLMKFILSNTNNELVCFVRLSSKIIFTVP